MIENEEVIYINNKSNEMLKKNIDLHIHTNKSDGSKSIHEIFEMAERRSLDIISITDHDSVSGITEFMKNQYECNAIVVSGIEFSVDWKVPVHILGYGIDIYDDELNKALDKIKKYRMEELIILIRNLKKNGINIPMSKLITKAQNINLDILAKCICELNYASDPVDARKRYLGKDSLAYVKKKCISLEEAISVIKRSGGIPVLAHPGRISADYNKTFGYIKDLILEGIEGIEVYSPHNSDCWAFRDFCLENKIFYTGGSDYHTGDDNMLGIDYGNDSNFLNSVIMKLKDIRLLQQPKNTSIP